VFTEPYIITEIAQAHDGSLGIAHSYIDTVAELGVAAIKFQTHYAEEESSPEEPWRVKFSLQDESRYEYWQRIEFTPEQWKGIGDHCREKQLDFISSPFSLKAVEVLEDAGVDAYKVASGEMNNILLLEAIAATGKPVILSSGMSDFEEIDRAVKLMKDSGNELTLLQCTTSYPVEPERVGLNVIKEMAERYDCSVGLSDHSGEIFAGLAAISVGASCLEVHVTFSKSMFGPDTPASLTPDQIQELVQGANWIFRARSNPVNKDEIQSEFDELRKIFTKSFAARRDLPRGTVISVEDISLKKPLKGISASTPEMVIGKRTNSEIRAGEFITLDLLEE